MNSTPDKTLASPTASFVVVANRLPVDRIEHEWGRVLTWEPPTRIVYSWHLRADAADCTRA